MQLRLLARLIEAASEDPVDPDSLPVEPGADFNFSNMVNARQAAADVQDRMRQSAG